MVCFRTPSWSPSDIPGLLWTLATPPGALTPRGPAPLLPDGTAKGGGGVGGHDDELTNLTWLQEANLLRKLAGPPSSSTNHQGNGHDSHGHGQPEF
ncbi:hypothetical protein MRX96_007298 [Rhipicephalus microplus]